MGQIPVSGEVLKWAREFRMLTIEDAADKIGISEQDLEDLEEEIKAPTLGQFEKIAHQYKLPQATLFRSKPPKTPTLPDDFRTFEGRPPRFSYDFSVSFSNVLHLNSSAHKVFEDDEDWKVPILPSIPMSNNPDTLGEAERRRLGITPDDQLGWSAGEAFRRWRSIIESQGIFVFLQEFPLDDCRGFTIYENNDIPVIVINKSEQFDRARTFTLLHEYAHILVRKPGISDLNRKNPVESFCNKFAAGFLMPKDAIRSLIKTWPNAPADWEEKDIKRWAGRLKVSQWALALRFEELGLAPEGFHRKFSWHRGYTSRKPSLAPGGPDPNVTKLSEMGGYYVSQILGSLDRKIISEAQVVDALGISTDAFSKARDYIARYKEFASGT